MHLFRRKLIPSLIILLLFTFLRKESQGQCNTPIHTFPYQESFEANEGGWSDGGTASDWTWGIPSRTVINSAGAGAQCWMTGGLTGSGYNDSESSWLQSPCFDFSSLDHPYISFSVFWETENRYDGAALQYSLDEGDTWQDVGAANEVPNCLNVNWYNQSSINYLGNLSGNRHGWSGNIQSTSGSCQGGGGSGGWVRASHELPQLAGKGSVIFRFIFGSGSICNNFDGFAIDEIRISEAPENSADFEYTCLGERRVQFNDNSSLCPNNYSWDFGDPLSGTSNQSTEQNPQHIFSSPGTYTVRLTVTSTGNAPSTVTKEVIVLGVSINRLSPADCNNNSGGSLEAIVTGGAGNYLFNWNSVPVQSSRTAINLASGIYTVQVSADEACGASTSDTVVLDRSCVGVFFPSAFTPNGDGKNDLFGPLGSIALLRNYNLSIYNRWGEKVFHATDPLKKWDGKHRGGGQTATLFTWFAKYDLPGGTGILRKGTILVIR